VYIPIHVVFRDSYIWLNRPQIFEDIVDTKINLHTQFNRNLKSTFGLLAYS